MLIPVLLVFFIGVAAGEVHNTATSPGTDHWVSKHVLQKDTK